MPQLLAAFPTEVRRLIRDFASDRLAPHPTAELVKRLRFDPDCPHNRFFRDGHASTVVHTDGLCYFRAAPYHTHQWEPQSYLRFLHSQFDERNFPHHFGS